MPMSRDQANELLDRVRRLASWKTVAKRSQSPAWFGELWTQLCVLVGGEPVEFVNGELAGTADEPVGELQLFTTSRIVHGSVEASDGSVRTQAWTTSRRTLQRVEARGGTAFFALPGTEDWPGPVRVRAIYPDGEVVLPAGQVSRQQWEQFEEFLGSLLADLSCDRGAHHDAPAHRRPGWAW